MPERNPGGRGKGGLDCELSKACGPHHPGPGGLTSQDTSRVGVFTLDPGLGSTPRAAWNLDAGKKGPRTPEELTLALLWPHPPPTEGQKVHARGHAHPRPMAVLQMQDPRIPCPQAQSLSLPGSSAHAHTPG